MQRLSWFVFVGIMLLLAGCGTNKAQQDSQPPVGTKKEQKGSRPFVGTWTRSLTGITTTWVFKDDGSCTVIGKPGTWQEANGVITITETGGDTYHWNWTVANDGRQLTLTRPSGTGVTYRRVLDRQ